MYSPLTPGRADENRTRLRTLTKRAAERLADADDAGMADRLLAPLRQMAAGKQPTPMGGGLGYFASPAGHTALALHSPPVERVAVGSVFVVRPLLPEACDAGYFLLALSHRAATLYRGTSAGIHPVEVPGMPAGIEDALRTHDSDEPLTLHSFRRNRAEAIFHGHGVGIDDHKDDLVRYFRAVDRAVHPVLRGESDPLVLAGVGYLFPLYAEANSYPHLESSGVPGNPDYATLDALHRAAWPLVATDAAAERAVRQFRQARGTGRTTCNIQQIVEAAVAGGLETLLLTPMAEAWGHYDPAGHRVEVSASPGSGNDELWNLAAVHVLRHRGEVYEVEPEGLDGSAGGAVLRMPVAAPA